MQKPRFIRAARAVAAAVLLLGGLVVAGAPTSRAAEAPIAARVVKAAALAGHGVSAQAPAAGDDPVDVLVAAATQAAGLREQAAAAMTPEAWRRAQDGTAAVASLLDHDAARRGKVRLNMDALSVTSRAAQEVQVDQALLWHAAALVSSAIDALIDAHHRGVAIQARQVATPLGDIVVDAGDGPCDDTYDRALFVVVDLCGNDTYITPAAGADGLGAVPVSVVVDLTGDDTAVEGYETPSVGSALNGGLALFVDGGGNDAWGAGTGSQIGGTGYLGGLGVMIDLAGDDTYRASGFLAPGGKFGTGHFAGSGVLVDVAGDDTYSADTFQQGSGWFGNAFGLLIDEEGNDTYDDVSTYAQGSGGVGGVGILIDRAGDDVYRAYSVFEQGAAVCGGIGLLADLAGDDLYEEPAGHSQGFAATGLAATGCGDETGDGLGERLLDLLPPEARALVPDATLAAMTRLPIGAAAALVDLGGSDRHLGGSYSNGSHIGNAAALVLTRGGNDDYRAAECSQAAGGGTTAQCTGWFSDAGAPGIAAFVDTDGDDRYNLWSASDTGQGAAYGGSIVTLVDGAGADWYSTGIRDGGGISIRGHHGIAVDVLHRDGTDPAVPELPSTTASSTHLCSFWEGSYLCAAETVSDGTSTRVAYGYDSAAGGLHLADGDRVRLVVDPTTTAASLDVNFPQCLATLAHVSTERQTWGDTTWGSGSATGHLCGGPFVTEQSHLSRSS